MNCQNCGTPLLHKRRLLCRACKHKLVNKKYAAVFCKSVVKEVRDGAKRITAPKETQSDLTSTNWLEHINTVIKGKYLKLTAESKYQVNKAIFGHIKACEKNGHGFDLDYISEVVMDASKGVFLFNEVKEERLSSPEIPLRNYAKVYGN